MLPLSSYNTSLENQTEVFDDYCTELFVGPLVWAVFSMSCACVGVPASVWLLWVLIQRQRRALSNDVYMLNLTVMDLLFNLSILPTTINYLFLRNDSVVTLTKILYFFNSFGRPLFMACICVDCYIAVVFPIRYRKMKNSKHRIVVCALSWGLTLLFGLMFDLIDTFNTSFTMIPYAFTLPTITFCDLFILRALRKPDPSGRSDVHPQKQRALQTITNSLVMTIVAYLPPMVVHAVSSLMPLSRLQKRCSLTFSALIFPLLGSTFMPLLYLGNLGIFTDLRRLLCFKCN